MDSLLVNTIKEMTQGVLLDKIYDEGNLNNVIKIMTSRRFEDSCIRPEYRKFKTKGDNSTDKWNNKYPDRGQKCNNNFDKNQSTGPGANNQGNQNDARYNVSGQYKQNFSGRYNNNNRQMNSGNFQRQQTTGNPKQNSGQYRQNQPRQNQVEPIEIDNVETDQDRSRIAGHPSNSSSQNRLQSPRQSNRESEEYKE
ncbi:GATA zinc finger domain-containing protein 15-like, partial [Rhagoletis pomonella]|uniref:GATA zinc finger domain-containing protein 15-like n=1 Tax=Rhagoletis pomonella TaxID=28610 RepID=UPI00177D37F4